MGDMGTGVKADADTDTDTDTYIVQQPPAHPSEDRAVDCGKRAASEGPLILNINMRS